MHQRLTREERRFLERARLCRIGSTDRRGRPHVAPLCHAFDAANRTAYVATEDDGVTAANLRARPWASIECDDYFEDWNRIRGVVAQARARWVTRGPELERAARLLRKKFKQYKTEDFDFVVALRVESVTSWGL
ncbi:MAG: pyridoxamine 5'-phosphate oxidase family protein [Actinomycetota bacterium]